MSIIAGNPKKSNISFTIYTNEVLNNTGDDAQIAQYAAITFDALMDFEYTNQVNIAYEPLENGDFSSDSLQNTPYSFSCTGVCAPLADKKGYKWSDLQQKISDVINQIETYLQNTTILTILKNKPLFQIYDNIKIVKWTYSCNPERTVLFANLTFQQIRITETQYSSSAPVNTFGNAPLQTLPQNQLANPTNASQINNGMVQGIGQTPTPSIAGQLR